MDSRQRLLAALEHREPDRVPLDLGATQVTGIHSQVYANLRQKLGLSTLQPTICDDIQGLALLARLRLGHVPGSREAGRAGRLR